MTLSRPSSGEKRIPASPAVAPPSAHVNALRRAAENPAASTSSRSSTRARIAVPTRLTRKNTVSPTSTATPSTTMISWSQPTFTENSRNVEVGRNGSTFFGVAPKMATAAPCSTMSRAIVRTIFVAWAASWMPRNSSRSMAMPSTGAITPRASTMASGVGSPTSSRSTWKP